LILLENLKTYEIQNRVLQSFLKSYRRIRYHKDNIFDKITDLTLEKLEKGQGDE